MAMGQIARSTERISSFAIIPIVVLPMHWIFSSSSGVTVVWQFLANVKLWSDMKHLLGYRDIVT